jgi:hypothetical protein
VHKWVGCLDKSPKSLRTLAFGNALAIVTDDEHQFVGSVLQLDVNLGGLGMTGHVGQRFLKDAGLP